MAVALLVQLGYRVVASTGRSETHAYLRSLGAHEILDRRTLMATSQRPLEPVRWSGAIDSVGGDTLATLLRTMSPRGCIAACGLAGGTTLNTTVMPFILRGVSLIGIDSPLCPQEKRREAWTRLARTLPPDLLEQMMQIVPLKEVLPLSYTILQGKVRGRLVVDVNAE